MSVTELGKQIEALPMADRIELAMSLWDSIDENTIKSPAWHAEELQCREQEIASGDAKFIPWNKAKAEILGRTAR